MDNYEFQNDFADFQMPEEQGPTTYINNITPPQFSGLINYLNKPMMDGILIPKPFYRINYNLGLNPPVLQTRKPINNPIPPVVI